MNVIENRFAGRNASLDKITHYLNQQLGKMTLSRIELRYSTQADACIAPQEAKQAIGNLLRESGMGTVAISVRSHELPIEDASGEHLLRLFPLAPADSSTTPQASSWVRRWLSAYLPSLGERAKAGTQDSSGQAKRDEPAPQHRQSPSNSIGKPVAIAHLRQALALSTACIETGSGSVIVAGKNKEQTVGEARIIVRQEGLHQVLQPIIANDLKLAAQSIGPMLEALGVGVTADFQVAYHYMTRKAGDGTSYASEADLQVVLRLAGANANPASKSPSLHSPGSKKSDLTWPSLASADIIEPKHADVAKPVAKPVKPIALVVVDKPGKPVNGTLLPKAEVWRTASNAATLMPARAPACVVRVVGTLEKNFAQVFEISFPTLPARFDRDALQKAGFAAEHANLLAVVSNSCPLMIVRNSAGQVVVQASSRKLSATQSLPMYYRRDTLAALPGEIALAQVGAQLVVNVPQGVHDPVSGRTLPALVIEICLAQDVEN